MNPEQNIGEIKAQQARSPEFYKQRERIQVELMKRYIRDRHVPGSENDGAEVWIEHYSKLFSDTVALHPEMIDEYAQDPEVVIKKFEEILYADDAQLQAA